MKKSILKVFLFFSILGLPNIILCQVNISSFSQIIEGEEEEEEEEINYSKWLNVKEVNLYGAGNVLGLVTGANDVDKTASPTGSIGINFRTSKIICDLFFSYNSKQKIEVNTLGQFGNTLMNPNLGGQSFTFKAKTNFTHRKLLAYGLSTSISVADNIYVIGENEIDASPTILRLGGYISPFNFSVKDNKVNIILDIHYTSRSILGDFSNEEQSIENKKILDKNYNGIDLTLNALLNNVNMFVQFSLNKKDKDFLIPGYSGTQVLFGLEVSGNFIKLK